VCLYVDGRRVLVVGTGAPADQRAKRLERAGAVVERIAPSGWSPELARGAFAVFAADPNRELCRQIAGDARAGGCLVYAQDLPDASDLSMPALAARGPLQIAISTDGVAPALARRLREQLETALIAAGTALDELIAELARMRETLSPRTRAAQLYARACRLRLQGQFHVDLGHSEGDEPGDASR
jgi:precorrin-2 dehydrogenase/sirohydrochlorin ferrochelatase